MKKQKPKCYKCNREENFPTKNKDDQVELRPYGPRGEWVCFRCAMETEESRAQTKRSFLQQLGACESPVIGLNVGPIELESALPILERKDA